MNLTREQINDRGEKAFALLTNTTFQELFDIVTRDVSEGVLAHSADKTNERLELLHIYDGMRAFTHHLNHYQNEMVRLREESELRDELDLFPDN